MIRGVLFLSEYTFYFKCYLFLPNQKCVGVSDHKMIDVCVSLATETTREQLWKVVEKCVQCFHSAFVLICKAWMCGVFIYFIHISSNMPRLCVCRKEGKGANTISCSALLHNTLHTWNAAISGVEKKRKLQKHCARVDLQCESCLSVPSVRIRNRLLHVCFSGLQEIGFASLCSLCLHSGVMTLWFRAPIVLGSDLLGKQNYLPPEADSGG